MQFQVQLNFKFEINWNTQYFIRSQTFFIKISSEHDSVELAG